jgi:hypothetical protein
MAEENGLRTAPTTTASSVGRRVLDCQARRSALPWYQEIPMPINPLTDSKRGYRKADAGEEKVDDVTKPKKVSLMYDAEF